MSQAPGAAARLDRATGQVPAQEVGSSLPDFMAPLGHQITEEEYRWIGRLLYARFRRAGLRPGEAEDVVQDTFFTAQRQLNEGKFRGESALDTWIVGIGKNQLGKHFRFLRAKMRDADEVPIDEPDRPEDGAVAPQLPEPGAGPERTAVCREEVAAVFATLRTIPREILLPFLLKVAGHSIQEISEMLGISPGLVTSRVHQVRAKLRQVHGRGS